jgi:hypothetical protein
MRGKPVARGGVTVASAGHTSRSRRTASTSSCRHSTARFGAAPPASAHDATLSPMLLPLCAACGISRQIFACARSRGTLTQSVWPAPDAACVMVPDVAAGIVWVPRLLLSAGNELLRVARRTRRGCGISSACVRRSCAAALISCPSQVRRDVCDAGTLERRAVCRGAPNRSAHRVRVPG